MERLTELRALAEISRTFREIDNRERLFSELTRRTAALLKAEQCSLVLWNEATREFVCQWPAYGLTQEQVAQGRFSATQGEALLEHIPEDGALIINDASEQRALSSAFLKAWGEQALLIARLQIGERVLGGIRVANKTAGRRFTEEDARLLGLIADQAAMAIEKLTLYRRLEAEVTARAAESDVLRQVAEALTVPLYVGDRRLGVLNLATGRPDAARGQQLRLLTAVGHQIAIGIERAQFHEQLQAQRLAEQQVLLRLSQALIALTDPEAVMGVAGRIVQDALGVEYVSVLRPDASGRRLVLEGGASWDEEMYGRYRVGIEWSREGYAFRRGVPVQQIDVQSGDSFPCPPELKEHGIVSGIGVPLQGEGGVHGTVIYHETEIGSGKVTSALPDWFGHAARKT